MRFTFRLARNEQLLLLGVLLAIAAFWGGLSELVGRWYKQEEYSHGFFLPLISLFLLWYRRDVLKKSRGAPSAWGLVLLLVQAVASPPAPRGKAPLLRATPRLALEG